MLHRGWALLTAIVCMAMTLCHAQETPLPGLDQAATLRSSQAVIGNTVSDFTLLNREGQPVRLSRYRGKPLLVSFIYSGCFQACPLTTRSLSAAIEAGKGVFGSNQFNIISIGFNQPADTPQSLKAFARQHGIAQSNWDFLSPPAAIVDPLTRDFGFSYRATPAGFDHTAQVTLVDAEGRIYRQIYGDTLSGDAIVEPLRQLLANAPQPQRLGFAELMDRVRVLCTVYDPKSGTYQFKYGLLLEIAGGFTFALAMLWFFLAEWLARRRARHTRTVVRRPEPAELEAAP